MCELSFNLVWSLTIWKQIVKAFTGPYSFKFVFAYYTTKAQEDAVTAKVQAVRSQLNLAGKSDYEKIVAIYDYLCDNVVYDNANLNDPNYNLKYSAYAALVNGTSVCQGYSNLFYRLALEEGIDCRFIFGYSKGMNHSWNIVKLGSVYYNLDATWDAVTKDHRYFLKTDAAHMDDHTKSAEYTQAAFLAAHPMATSDYTIPGNTTPVTPPVTPPPAADPQPTTTPTTPATQPETQPPTEPETQPTPQPSQAATEPTTVPAATDPTTIPTETTSPDTSQSATGTQQNTTGNSENSTKTEEEKSDKTWILALGGVALLGAAAGAAALLSQKRR